MQYTHTYIQNTEYILSYIRIKLKQSKFYSATIIKKVDDDYFLLLFIANLSFFFYLYDYELYSWLCFFSLAFSRCIFIWLCCSAAFIYRLFFIFICFFTLFHYRFFFVSCFSRSLVSFFYCFNNLKWFLYLCKTMRDMDIHER